MLRRLLQGYCLLQAFCRSLCPYPRAGTGADAFRVVRQQWHGTRPLISLTRLHAWDKSLLPATYRQAADMLQTSLLQALSGSSDSSSRMFSLDLLLPGLNPKLEQKAILRTELLFRLVASFIPVLSSQYEEILFAFPSIGDAAGFQKYCFQTNVYIPSTIILGEVDRVRVTPLCDCVLFIASRNNVGDPVLREVQHIVDERLGANPVHLFLNCDLSDKVTTGLTQRSARDAFRARIKPAFHLRNIVTIQRTRRYLAHEGFAR